MWVDTHCHIPMLKHDDRSAILFRAKLAKVDWMVTIGTEPEDWESSRLAAEQIPNVYFTLGLHPHAADRWTKVESELKDFFTDSSKITKCKAIGECGLDYHYDNSPRDLQKKCFEDQLKLAHEQNLPIVIHCRDAYEDLFAILRTHGLPKRGAIMHCFTGTDAVAKEAVQLGMMISFSGILTFKKAEPIREAAKNVPGDFLLVETDCPFLAPVPERGKPNEPSFIAHTGKFLAQVRGQSEEVISELTTKNARRLFGF